MWKIKQDQKGRTSILIDSPIINMGGVQFGQWSCHIDWSNTFLMSKTKTCIETNLNTVLLKERFYFPYISIHWPWAIITYSGVQKEMLTA